MKFILPYCTCFILGFLVANGIVTLKTGGPIEVGEWRKPTPAHDVNQFITNLYELNSRMFAFVSKMVNEVPIIIWALVGLFTLLSLNMKRFWILIILLVLFLSPFYTTVYHGILISNRTLLPSAILFAALFILLPALRFKHNILHYLLCLALMWPLFQTSSDQLKLFGKISGYYKHQLNAATAGLSPERNPEAIVFVTNAEVREINTQIKTHLNLNFDWCEPLSAVDRTVITVLRSMGYYSVMMMTDNKAIQNVKEQIQAASKTDQYSIINISQRPGAFGVVMNHTRLDTALLDEL